MSNIEKEIWKDVVGYEGLYKVSNYSRVWSVKRNIFLKPHDDVDGYCVVGLSKNGNQKNKKIHRLTMIAFVKNPNNYSQINHIDENKHNNYIGNLEWCDAKYNNNYGKRHILAKEKRENSVPINFPMKTSIYNRMKEKITLDNITMKDYLTSLISTDIKNDHRLDQYLNVDERISKG